MDKLFASVTRKVRVPAVVLATSLIVGAMPGYAEDVPTYPGLDELPEITLNIADGYAPNSALGSGTQAFVDYVTKASNGRIKPTVYWSGSLVAAPEMAEALAAGLADIGLVSPIYDPASFPIANWITTLANQASGGVPFGTQVFSGAHWEFAASSPQIQQEFADRGLHMLGAQTTPAFDMLCNKPVQTLAEAKGKRARAAGIVFSREVEALGMTAVPLVPAEMYEAFTRGIVDCMVLHPMGYQDFGIAQVEGDKYFVNLEFAGFNSMYHAISKAKWDSLPDVAKAILVDAYSELTRVQFNNTYKAQAAFGQLIAEGAIKTLQPAPDLVDALKTQQQQAVVSMTASAPAGIQDAQAEVDRYLALVEKWRGIVTTELGQSPSSDNVDEEVAAWAIPFDYAPFVARLKAEIDRL